VSPLVSGVVCGSPGDRPGVWLPWTGVWLAPLYQNYRLALLAPELVCGFPCTRTGVWLPWCQKWCVAPLVTEMVSGFPLLHGVRTSVWLPCCQNWCMASFVPKLMCVFLGARTGV
jgi:hypothetical protein